MLYISPQGKIAKWVNWTLLGLSKDEYEAIHITISVLFIVIFFFHVWYNWKSIKNYMRSKMKKMVFFTPEMTIALLLNILFVTGTYFKLPPFQQVIDFGDTIKEYWVDVHGEPPYGHAEEATIKALAQSQGIEVSKAISLLQGKKLQGVVESITLMDLGKLNGIAPSEIFKIIQGKKVKGVPQNRGMQRGQGRLPISGFIKSLKLDQAKVEANLKARNINYTLDKSLKDTANDNQISPMELLNIINE